MTSVDSAPQMLVNRQANGKSNAAFWLAQMINVQHAYGVATYLPLYISDPMNNNSSALSFWDINVKIYLEDIKDYRLSL